MGLTCQVNIPDLNIQKKLSGAAAKAKANAAQGLPEIIERYNVFHTSLIIRHANDGKMYLYDIIDIKKETSTPLEP